MFETGIVTVVLGQPATCGFCPDGVWQPDPLDLTLLMPAGSWQVGPDALYCNNQFSDVRSFNVCLCPFLRCFFFPAKSFLARCLFRASPCVVRGFDNTRKMRTDTALRLCEGDHWCCGQREKN